MLGLLAALAVLSALILVGFVFRPTPAQRHRRGAAIRVRETEAFSILGAFPTKEATDSYETLMRLADRQGVTIDWDRARREQAASADSRLSLTAVALRQV